MQRPESTEASSVGFVSIACFELNVVESIAVRQESLSYINEETSWIVVVF